MRCARYQADPQAGLDATFAVVPDLAADPSLQRGILDATVAAWSNAYTDAHGLGAIDPAAWEQSIAFMTGMSGNDSNATGCSCTPSAPTRSRTAASGNIERTLGDGAGARHRRRQLRQQRPRVPIHVSPPALGVPPPRPPRHARDHERRDIALRRGADLNERVLRPVVPVHPVRNPVDAPRARVHLEREPPARRSGGAEQEVAPVPRLGAHDAGAQEEHPPELSRVQRLRRNGTPARRTSRKRRDREGRAAGR